MTETLQLEPELQVHDVPKLLVEWSSPWQEFVTSVRPALARSDARLAGEAPYGMFPYRGMVPSLALEAFLIFAAIAIKVKIDQMRPYVAPRLSSHDVVYYSGDELPRTEDLGGAQSGATGRAGGEEAHHRTQTIRIARGGSLNPQVVDAPSLKLPTSRDAVANLLAIRPDPGPPPIEGMRSNRSSLTYQAPVVAPAPEVIHDYTRNGIRLDAVIPPTPSVARDPFRSAPNLSATVVPPAPSVSSDHTLVAPALGSAVIAPAPSVSRDRMQSAASLTTSVVAPAPSVTRDNSRSAPALAASVIAPAPAAVSREISSAPVQATNLAVVPPPVSAPQRATTRDPKLSLPSPSVISPPPSADLAQDMRHLPSGNVPDPSKEVVPPPPTPTGSGSLVSSLIGRIFGSSEVVPPPPAVDSGGSGGTKHTTLASNVVPPPPSVSASTGGGNPRGHRNGAGTALGSNIIPPPPSAGLSGGTGTGSVASSTAPAIGPPSVVPPPPSLSGEGGGSGSTGGGKGAPAGTLLANNVVPPPPTVTGGSSTNGAGTGRIGPGLGTSLDAGVALAPPRSGGSGNGAGVVASAQPGSKVGLPATGGKGALALSPAGGDKPGIGGAGGGTSISKGNGPGSGLSNEGPGTGKNGSGHGSDPAAHGGISPGNGPGGTGHAPSGNPAVAGVSVSGGSSVVTLPSFGSDPSAADPSNPEHSPVNPRKELGVTIVATATSGGAFEPYKNLLHGVTSTAYFNTSAGTAVFEFADEKGAGRGESLTSPQAIRTDLPAGLLHERMVLECTLDTSGNLKNLRVLEPGSAETTAKILAALRAWKLLPAMRGDKPVEVKAILGFGIDTNDRP